MIPGNCGQNALLCFCNGHNDMALFLAASRPFSRTKNQKTNSLRAWEAKKTANADDTPRCFLASLVSPTAADVVRSPCARTAVAAKPRSVFRLGERDHAATNPGGNSHRLLRPLSGGVSDDRIAGRGRRRRRSAIVGRIGLLPPRPATSAGGKNRRGRTRRQVPARSRDRAAVCRASAATRQGQFSRSPSTPGSRSLRPTPCGSSAGCWPTTAIRDRPRGNGFFGRWPKPCCCGAARAA